MSSRPSYRVQAPTCLDSFTGSLARRRLQHSALLMKWVIAWLGDTHDMTLPAALEGLAYAKMLRRIARALERVFEDAAIAELTHRDLTAFTGDGYQAVLRPGSTRKEWRNDAVMAELIEHLTADLTAAHPDLPAAKIRHLTTTTAWRLHEHGRIEWRAGRLRRSGIDPDDYSTHRPGTPSIDLTGPAAYPTLPAGLTGAP